MEKYKIEIKKSVEKELRNIPKKYLVKIINQIQSLADNPFPKSSIKLSSQENYRTRVGKYRILYSVEQKIFIICIVKVAHRKSIYR